METISTDVRLLMVQDLPEIHGILMAPPCTHFSSSGAQYWKAKDADGRTLDGLSIVDACLRLAVALEPIWWLLENPVGRLPRYIGPYQMTFQPHFYGDAYTKKTCLFGDFNVELPQTPVEPERVCIQGSWIQKLGGSSEKTKELRSITPSSFARAFFQANP
jgi:site-specific DNA-cytosine methylase